MCPAPTENRKSDPRGFFVVDVLPAHLDLKLERIESPSLQALGPRGSAQADSSQLSIDDIPVVAFPQSNGWCRVSVLECRGRLFVREGRASAQIDLEKELERVEPYPPVNLFCEGSIKWDPEGQSIQVKEEPETYPAARQLREVLMRAFPKFRVDHVPFGSNRQPPGKKTNPL